MGFHAIRLTRRPQGNSTTGSLAILASVGVLGIASFTQFGAALEENVKGETQASAFANPDDGEMAFNSPSESAQTPNVELGSSSSAAIDGGIANNLIDYVAGKGSRPSQIPAGSDADELLDEVLKAVKTLVGDDTATKNAVTTALKNNHGDLEKILFEGINDINDVSEEVRTAILEGIGKRIADGEGVGLLGEILESLENLGRNLEKNHAAGRAELRKVLRGESIADEPAADEPRANTPASDDANTADEPTADDTSATNEPAANDTNAADEPTAEQPAVEDSDQAGAGALGAEETGKAILDAINANPEASAAAATLLEDPEVIELVSDAASGKLSLDAKSIIELLRDKPGIVAVLEALVKDKKVMALLESQVDPQFLPLLKLLAANPDIVEKIAGFVRGASPSDMDALLGIIDAAQNGSFDPVTDLPKVLTLLGNDQLMGLVRELSQNEDALALASQYVPPVYLRVILEHPELIQDVSNYLQNASQAELALVAEVMNDARNGEFSLGKAMELLLNPGAYDLVNKLWDSEAGRAAIIDSIKAYAPGGRIWGPMLGWPVINRFVPSVARFIGLRNRVGTWNAIKMTFNGWLTNVTGQECSGIFNMCRVRQAGGLFAAGVKKVGGWIGGLFGGGDDEPAKAVGTTAREPVTTEGTPMTPSAGDGPSSAAPATVAANLPPVFGYTPAFPGLLQRQMMRIAAERSLESAPND